MRNHPSTTQDIDLRLLQNRQAEAVERWFLEYADTLYTFIFYRVGKDQDLATDLVQETFLTALRKIGDYDPQRGAMSAWLTYIARNCMRMALRRRERYESCSEFWEAYDRRLLAAYRELATSPLPQDVLEQKETVELVQMALSNIPDNYQRALKRHYHQAQSLKEIAHSEGITEGAVKSLLHRARLAFKTAFQTLAEAFDDSHPAQETIQ